MPSSPIRFSAGTFMSVKNTSVVAWFIMVRIGRISSPLFLASRMSTMNTERPSVRFFGLLLRRGARQQHHQVGMFGAAGPDLLAVDDVAVVAVLARKGLQRRRVGAAGRLGDAEGLQPQLAARDLRQVLCLLLGAAVPQHGAHRVHLGVAAAAVAAGALDLFEDRGGRRQLQAGAAIFLGDQHREVAGLRQRIDEGLGVGHLAIELAPVFAGKLRAELCDGFADVCVIFAVVFFSHGVSVSGGSQDNAGQPSGVVKTSPAPYAHLL